MAITLNEFINEVGWEIDEESLKSGVAKATKAVNSAIPIVEKVVKGISLPLIAMAGVSVKLASDAQEAESKFNTIFNSMEEGANKVANTFAKDFGLAGTSARTLLGDTSDMLTGFGFTQEGALGLSDQVNRLAVDLASFTNFKGGAKGASEALTKGLLGERESMKSLGIAILEADVKTEVLTMKQEGLTFATEREAKAMATYRIAVRQSKNAIGDYGRTKDQLANSVRRVQQRLLEFSIRIGKVMMPAVNLLTHALEGLVNIFIGMPSWMNEVLVIFGALVALLPIAVLGILLLGKAFLTFGADLVFATGGLILLIPVVIGFIALIIFAGIKIVQFGKKLVTGTKGWQTFKEGVMSVVNTFKRILIPILKVLGFLFGAWFKLILLPFKVVVKIIGWGISLILSYFGSWLKALMFIVNWIVDKFAFLRDYFADIFSSINDTLRNAMIGMLLIFLVPMKRIVAFFKEKIDWIFSKIQSAKDKLAELDVLQKGADAIVGGIRGVLGSDVRSTYDPEKHLAKLRADKQAQINQQNNITLQVPEGTTKQQGEVLKKVVNGEVKSALADPMKSALASTAGME